jgi:hypothetical protein
MVTGHGETSTRLTKTGFHGEKISNNVYFCTEDLENTLDEIDSSLFEVKQKEIFYIEWSFKDIEELYDYDFDRQDRECDNNVMQKMNALLGDRINLHPIVIREEAVVFFLEKRVN